MQYIFYRRFKYAVFLIAFFFIKFSFSQKETNIWYFGYGAGLDFNGGSPVALNNGVLYTDEGSASISDSNGNLLFYTNGDTVWNKNHQIMSIGIGLFGNISTTQFMIIQVPGNMNIYYIFTQGGCVINQSLYYSIVDVSLNGGVGEVTFKNIFLHDKMTEKLTAVKHCNNKDIWLIATEEVHYPFNDYVYSINKIHAYLITSLGINTSPIESKFTNMNGAWWNCWGQIKASPNGKHIAWDGGKGYCDFDNSTGIVSNLKEMNSPFGANSDWNYYGVEFSPNSQLIYNSQFQIDIKTKSIFIFDTDVVMQGLQLASNGKIYLTSNFADSLHVIASPNILGSGCNYLKNDVFLDGATVGGLPNFMASYFYHPKGEFTYTGDCPGNIISFNLKNSVGIDSVKWIFHDNSTSKLFNAVHIYALPGTYNVSAVTYSGGVSDTTSQCVSINGAFPKFLGKDTILCSGDSMTLNVPYPAIGKYQWSTGDTLGIIKVKKTGTYYVKVTNSCAIFSDTIVVFAKNCNTNSNIIAPNYMTPNDDGHNDFFKIQILDENINEEEVSCSIYNRWGEKVGSWLGSNGSWDGKTYSNGELSAGVYYWVLKYKDVNNQQKIEKGFLQLIR